MRDAVTLGAMHMYLSTYNNTFHRSYYLDNFSSALKKIKNKDLFPI